MLLVTDILLVLPLLLLNLNLNPTTQLLLSTAAACDVLVVSVANAPADILSNVSSQSGEN